MAESAYTGVGLGSQTPDMFGKLSQLLTIRGQQQGLAGQAAQVQQEEQTTRQRASLAKHDFSQYIGEDGTIDLNRMVNSPGLLADAGDQFLDIVSKGAAFKQQQLEAKSKLVGLRHDQREEFAAVMGGLSSDPDVAEDNEKGRQKVNEALVQYGEMYGEDVLDALGTYATQLRDVPQGQMPNALKSIQMQAVSASDQLEKKRPQYMNTGGRAVQISPYAPPGQSPQSIAMTLGPGEQDTVAVDQLGNPYRTLRDQRGTVTGTAPLAPGGNAGPATFGVGERATFEQQAEQNFANISANRVAASMAPQQLDQINKALNLSKQVSTGGWAAKRAHIESSIGSLIPGYAGMDDASKLQELDKFSERIATDASRVLGVNAKTDAERESIHRQNANIGYTPQAIQSVLQYAKAQTMAMEAKGNAQEAWLKKEGSGITKQHEFETEFRQAYDPQIFQLAVMSPEERKEARAKMSKEERATLREKAKKLIDLGVDINGE